MTFQNHIKTITKSAYYHLKNISRVKELMSQQDLEKLVHAFIFSRLDYCNSVFTGLTKQSIKQLQLIQNAAARVLTGTKKVHHITPVLRSLHWLPLSQRIDFKDRSGPLVQGCSLSQELEPKTDKQLSVFMLHTSGTNFQKTAGLLKLLAPLKPG